MLSVIAIGSAALASASAAPVDWRRRTLFKYCATFDICVFGRVACATSTAAAIPSFQRDLATPVVLPAMVLLVAVLLLVSGKELRRTFGLHDMLRERSPR
jgi:hypothetical protein